MTTQILFPLDTPRTRRSDPLASHMAADRSQANLPAVKAAVLSLIEEHGALTGSELNTLYRESAVDHGWPLVHFDSPRKRAGQLHADGLLNVLNEGCTRGTEREYTTLGVRQ